MQDCKKDEGPRCGGYHKNWEVLHPTLEKCCDFHLKWKSEECNRHESGSRRLTDSQKEENHHHLSISGLDIINTLEDVSNTMEGRLEDVSNAMEGKLEDVSNAMEGKLAWVESNDKEMKGDIEEVKKEVQEMKEDIKEMKALLAELVGRK